MAALPLPVATSSTRQPARRSAVSQSCSATSTIREATTAKSPLDHACCWRSLMASKSGLVASAAWVIGRSSDVRTEPASNVRASRGSALRERLPILGRQLPISAGRGVLLHELLVRLPRHASHEVELRVGRRGREMREPVGHGEEGRDGADLPDLLVAQPALAEPLEVAV